MLDYDVTINYDCYAQIYTMNPNGTITILQVLVNPGQPYLLNIFYEINRI